MNTALIRLQKTDNSKVYNSPRDCGHSVPVSPSRGGLVLFMKKRPNGGKPHPNSKDKSGMVCGRLTVLSRVVPGKDHSYDWLCRCECGKVVSVNSRKLNLKFLKKQSCGCSTSELISNALTTHGDSASREHHTWSGIIQRCHNPNSPAFLNYGGRGIKVCERWRKSYESFLNDMGRCPFGFTIERKNNNGDYEPENCCWDTRIKQGRNRRNNKIFTVRGITGCMSELAECFGIGTRTVWHRIRKARWSVEDAFLKPVMKSGYTWYGRP